MCSENHCVAMNLEAQIEMLSQENIKLKSKIEKDKGIKMNKTIEINGYVIKKSNIIAVSKIVNDYPNKEIFRFEVFFNSKLGYFVIKSDKKDEIEAKYAQIVEAMEE